MIVVEGIIAIAIVTTICFWISFALDYLPVKFGFRELSFATRAGLLTLVGAAVLIQLYRLVGRRLFVAMKDRSMALLVEKNYPQFGESLITTVEAASHHGQGDRFEVPVDPSMLALTRAKAESLIGEVQLGSVVSYSFLRYGFSVAMLLVGSLVIFALAKFDNLELAARRLYLLDGQAWPRQVQMELVGLKMKVDVPVQGIAEIGQTVQPKNSVFRLPKGASASLIVRAQASDPLRPWRRLPSSCQLRYRSTDGNRGTQVLNRIGNPRDGWQTYTLNGSPLQGLLSDLTFDVRGDDFRTQPFRIEVVEEPVVTETQLDCVFPDYLSSDGSLSWTPRRILWTGRAELPRGTKFTIEGRANKSLSKVYAWDATTKTMAQGIVAGQQFQFSLPQLLEPARLQFYLVDSDQIVSANPHAIFVEPIVDQPPDVITKLVGIGSAITPNAILPFAGQVTDDYQVQKTWIELTTAKRTLPPENQNVNQKGELDSSVDLAELVRAGLELTVDDGSELEFVVKANDWYSLNSESPNVGVGDKYTLELVSANRLLRILERLEVGERRRLEQVFEEVSNIRGYLSRTRKREPDDSADRFTEPGDARLSDVEPGDSEIDNAAKKRRREQALRIVFAQRSSLQASKSAQEIKAIAASFDNLRMQLVNNRIDAQDRTDRLQNSIVVPLRSIADPDGSLNSLNLTIEELAVILKQIDKGLGDDQTESVASRLVDRGLTETDAVLKEIDAVLAMLVKYESQNELLDIVRRLIAEQEALMKQTKDQRQRDAFEGLLDD